MSGKDEEPIRDFPNCLCDGNNGTYFWVGRIASNTVYFDCVGYQGIIEPRVICGFSNNSPRATLEEVNQVRSIGCGYCRFRAGEKLFEKIIELGRKIVVRER